MFAKYIIKMTSHYAKYRNWGMTLAPPSGSPSLLCIRAYLKNRLPQPAAVAGFGMLTEQIPFNLAGSGFRHTVNKFYLPGVFIGGGDGFDVLLQFLHQ